MRNRTVLFTLADAIDRQSVQLGGADISDAHRNLLSRALRAFRGSIDAPVTRAPSRQLDSRQEFILVNHRRGATFSALGSKFGISTSRARSVYLQARELIVTGKCDDPDEHLYNALKDEPFLIRIISGGSGAVSFMHGYYDKRDIRTRDAIEERRIKVKLGMADDVFEEQLAIQVKNLEDVAAGLRMSKSRVWELFALCYEDLTKLKTVLIEERAFKLRY